MKTAKKKKHKINTNTIDWSKPKPDRALRNDFYKRLGYVAIALLPIFLLLNETGPLRFIALAGFLVVMYQFLILIRIGGLYFNEFFPPKTYNETKTKPFDKFMYYFASVLFPLGVITALFGMGKIEDTINGMTLFWNWAFIGLGVALSLNLVLHITNPFVYYESKRRSIMYLGSFLGFFMIFPFTAGLINYAFSDTTVTYRNYRVEEKITGSKGAHWIMVKTRPDENERFDVSRGLYDILSTGGTVKMSIKKGKLGYEVVIKKDKA